MGGKGTTHRNPDLNYVGLPSLLSKDGTFLDSRSSMNDLLGESNNTLG